MWQASCGETFECMSPDMKNYLLGSPWGRKFFIFFSSVPLLSFKALVSTLLELFNYWYCWRRGLYFKVQFSGELSLFCSDEGASPSQGEFRFTITTWLTFLKLIVVIVYTNEWNVALDVKMTTLQCLLSYTRCFVLSFLRIKYSF